jgi:choline dehydrogenase-like flavoprotein
VVLLESGGSEPEAGTQALYDVELSGLPHPGSTQGRFRVLGGSTTKWGGQALPLLPSDFERRDWVANSGWPLTFAEMQTYYARAADFLLIDRLNFDNQLLSLLRAKTPDFDPQKIWYHFSKWSPRPNLRELYLQEIRASEKQTLLLHANVTSIVLNENLNAVESICARSLHGWEAIIRARSFVLCVGGIETARLLLANCRQQPKGIGNANDLVGRYFQDHPNIFAGWLKSPTPRRVQRLFNVFHKKGVKYSVRFTAAPRWQQENQTLSTSGGLMFVEDNATLENLKELYRALRTRRVDASVVKKSWSTAGHPLEAAMPIWHYLVRGRSYSPRARFQVCLTCEQEPDAESRILLSGEKDALGMPRANVRWNVSDLTWRTMLSYARMLQEEFRRAGIGEIELDPWIHDGEDDWRRHIMDQFHHMGTTRMHDSPRHGVVDRDCRVHGLANFHIGGSSVFPTSGHSNPTLTIIALCMRLSDRLKHDLT